jgi:predicted transcriptional regulator
MVLVWMDDWDFLVNIPGNALIDSVSYTAELSAECPGTCQQPWPSNLTISLNGVDINTWELPGDPGTGWLTTWAVNNKGTYFMYKYRTGNMKQRKVSDITIDQLGINPGDYVVVTLSVKFSPTGGGLNIYGKGISGFTYGSYYPGNTPTIRVNYTIPDAKSRDHEKDRRPRE